MGGVEVGWVYMVLWGVCLVFGILAPLMIVVYSSCWNKASNLCMPD